VFNSFSGINMEDPINSLSKKIEILITRFELAGDGYFRIKCRHSGLYLDAWGGGPLNSDNKIK
jgi:hypothetical protein